MDPEQLERLETALQSEQAKQILGENVTAMLDMLSVEEETAQLTDSIRMDHCYTNLSPSSAPVTTSTPNHQYGPVGSSDTDTSDNSFEQENVSQTVVTTANSTQPTTRGRGRGRGPGRPRRDVGGTRSTQSFRGASTRGTGRGIIRTTRGGIQAGGSVPPGMVMVQQIKQINPPLAPPPSSPSSASLVPLIKPLVMADRQKLTATITVPVSSGGTRLVTLTGTKLGQVVAGGQQRVLITTNRTLQQQPSTQQLQKQQQQRQIQQKQQKQKQNILPVKQDPVPTSEDSQLAQQQDLGNENFMLLKIESDFTHFPGREEENEDVDASDDDSDEPDPDDEEYIVPGSGRRRRTGSKFRGGNRRLMRGARTRGSNRTWDRGGARGLGKTGVKRRGGGRGRGAPGRPEDLERAQRLEAEMAAALAAMDQSPEKETVTNAVGSEKVDSDKDSASIVTMKQEVQVADVEPEVETSPVRKKAVKVYGKSSVKKKLPMNKETEGKDNEVTESKKTPEKIPTSPTPEKKPAIKSPVRKHSTELPQPLSTVPTSASTGTETPKVDRKNYPKRENRKPPAHLAEALGPALFSTPDIIRRVSTGSEQKTPTTPEAPTVDSKKENSPVEAPPGEEVSQPVSTAPVAEEDIQVPEDQGLLETLNVEATKTEEELLADTLLLQQHIAEDGTPMETDSSDIKKPLEPNSNSGEAVSSIDIVVPTPEVESPPSISTVKPSAKPHATPPVAATRSSRRRTSNVNVQKLQKPLHKSNKPSQKKEENQTKTKQFRLKGEQDEEDEDESEVESSDDESWNSEDDPDRLWCICKKPHNNRFMICCDSCEDWFHGQCVGVTKSIGKQMEESGLEWVCPNCTKKKEVEGKEKERETKKQAKTAKEKDGKKPAPKEILPKENVKDSKEPSSAEEMVTSPVQKHPASSTVEGIMFCIVCKKEARPTSIYCSDACILKHAQESLSLINKEKPTGAQGTRNQTHSSARLQSDQQVRPQSASVPSTATQLPRSKPDDRVIVFERKTGRLLAGPNAPTAGNLKTWLKDNPTFEVVRPGVMPTTKFYNQKTVAQLKQAQNTKAIAMQSKLVPIQAKPVVVPPTKTVPVQPKTTSAPVSPNKTQTVQPAGRTSKPTLTVAISRSDMTAKGTVKVNQGLKSPTGTPKAVVKPAGNSVNVQQSSKPVLSPTVSKAPATSTVKETSTNKNQSPMVSKRVEAKRSSSTSSTEAPKKEEEKPSGPEPIRLNVRKTLQDLLQKRIQESSDLTVAEEDLQDIALNIEEEMHTFFRDTGIKYKSKYRSLVYNIKDPKNLTLFRKILDKSVTPHQLVRLSPEELASQELAQWREREAKHQLEMIKKNELDLMALSKTYIMKTHKGEQVIETDESLKTEVPELVDPSAVPDIVSALNNSVSSTVEDITLEHEKEKSKDKGKESKTKDKRKDDKDRSSRDRDRSKRDDKKKDSHERGRSKDKEGSRRDSRSDRESRHSRERGKSSSRNKHRHHHHSSDRDKDRNRKEKRDEDSKKDEPHIKKEEIKKSKEEEKKSEIKDEDKNIKNAPNAKTEEDSDLSDREPSSTVIIKTPDINIDDGSIMGSLDVEKATVPSATVWKGFVNMPDVAKFFTTVQVVSGDSQNLCRDLPDTIVWDYISKMKKSGTKEILVIRLSAANEEEKKPYLALYTYLNVRNRMGVVGSVSKMIKDFYIMPLAGHNPVPQVLLPLDGPGFEDVRPHLLLGILVRARRKRLAPELTYVAKVPKRPPPLPAVLETPERSYTPPLPGTGDDDIGSLTPPHPPPALPSSEGYTPPHSPKRSSINTNKFRPSGDPRLRKTNQDVPKESGIPEKKQEELFLAEKVSTPTTPKFNLNSVDEDDDDAPYSPGGGMDEDNMELTGDNLLSTPKNPIELQRKMEELNRQIEEQRQQIESISSAIVGTDTTNSNSVGVAGVESLQVNTMMQSYMIGAGEDAQGTTPNTSADAEDENEAYSPSRSFTPPTSDSIPFIGTPSDPTSSVLSSIPSNISLPSNLCEILASIKKRESDTNTKGINLKEDPIVQNYTCDLESTKAENEDPSDIPHEEETSRSSSSYGSTFVSNKSSTSQPSSSNHLNLAASSVVPALLSLSTPVVHPGKAEGSVGRDPRQKQTETSKPASTLSSLSDDDLIKKAMEMEEAEKSASFQQPLPPGVDNFPAAAPPPPPLPSKPVAVPDPALAAASAPAPLISLPIGQPLPPGLEDEEFPTYTPPFPLPPNAPTPELQPHLPSPNQNVNFSRHPNPVNYHVPPHHYNPPPPSHNMGPPPHFSSSQGSNFNPPYGSAPPGIFGGVTGGKSSKPMDEPTALLRSKRKFQDGEDNIPPGKRNPNGQGREPWDKKVPVPMRGRYNQRSGMRSGGGRYGNRSHHSQRGYMRQRGRNNGPPHRSRWGPPNSEDDKSRYDANIRSEWDSHIKEFEEKRTRERQRERERERDRSSSNRSYNRSNKNRNSDKGRKSSNISQKLAVMYQLREKCCAVCGKIFYEKIMVCIIRKICRLSTCLCSKYFNSNHQLLSFISNKSMDTIHIDCIDVCPIHMQKYNEAQVVIKYQYGLSTKKNVFATPTLFCHLLCSIFHLRFGYILQRKLKNLHNINNNPLNFKEKKDIKCNNSCCH
ncbi:hypothetical protein C0J52_01640 [Blattella germanica]|nr:hypothetical protein C0J52_01640 [Blattella germanica]